jgi:hypothetical protein
MDAKQAGDKPLGNNWGDFMSGGIYAPRRCSTDGDDRVRGRSR